MHRWETAFLIGGSILLAIAMAIVAWQLDSSRETLIACYAQPVGAISEACRSSIEWGNVLAGAIGMFGTAATLAPFAVGVFLGAPLIAREIEHRTAPIAWSLSVSRRRWLAGRALPVLALVLVALTAVGQASELLLRTAAERELGFQYYAMFGPLIPARGLAVFAIGVLAGLALGRVLPAVLLTALAAVVLVGGLSIGRDLIMREEAVWRPIDSPAEPVYMVFDQGFLSDSGEIISFDVAFQLYPDAFDQFGAGAPPGMTPVWRIVPADQFGLYVVREIGALAIAFAAAAIATVGLVQSRRPG